MALQLWTNFLTSKYSVAWYSRSILHCSTSSVLNWHFRTRSLMYRSNSAVVCCLDCLMSPRYSSLACQWEELFSKLLAKHSNTASAFTWSSLSSWSFKVSHLSDASCPPKNRMCVTWSSLGVCAMVKYCLSLCVKKFQLASLFSACQFMWGSISGGRLGIPGAAIALPWVIVTFHFGRMLWSWNENASQGQIIGFNDLTLVTHLGGIVLYPPIEGIRAGTNWHTPRKVLSLWEGVLVS